jgi:hypothetical protein
MKTFLKSLVARFRSRPPGRKAVKPRPAVRPGVEGLEERACPDVSLTQAIRTLQVYNAALQAKIGADAQGLVVHVVGAEAQSPSLLGGKGGKLLTDLGPLYKDAKANAAASVSADFTTFNQDLKLEAALVNGFHLASGRALLNNPQIASDVAQVNRDLNAYRTFLGVVSDFFAAVANPRSAGGGPGGAAPSLASGFAGSYTGVGTGGPTFTPYVPPVSSGIANDDYPVVNDPVYPLGPSGSLNGDFFNAPFVTWSDGSDAQLQQIRALQQFWSNPALAPVANLDLYSQLSGQGSIRDAQLRQANEVAVNKLFNTIQTQAASEPGGGLLNQLFQRQNSQS